MGCIFSQDLNLELKGGQFLFNPSSLPCITDEQRELIKVTLNSNISKLEAQNRLINDYTYRGANPLFVWPVQKSTSSNYNDVWSISNYVDHNTSFPNQLTDYNCQGRTYDTASGYNHQGIDIFNWPFTWKIMDNDEAEIVAAADGQIIGKSDGEYDRSCNFNNNFWNAIYVQHSDGSIAWYGHMKNGSLTSKNIGEIVSQGEYLGVVGSSGNSTGPHLHFEVHTDATYSQLVDPYVGPCNTMNTETWWQSQKPYTNPRINAALTHSDFPVFPTCPTTETTNESDFFDADDTIYFAIYLRDQYSGSSVNLKIIRPDNSILYDWNYALNDNYYASWWTWYFSGVYNMNGNWRWEATYEGETVSHTFNVSGALNIEDVAINQTRIFPNPFTEKIYVAAPKKISGATVIDLLGNIIKTYSGGVNGLVDIDLSYLSKGMYFVKLNSKYGESKIVQVVKK